MWMGDLFCLIEHKNTEESSTVFLGMNSELGVNSGG